MVGPGDTFQNKGSQLAGEHYFETIFFSSTAFDNRAVLRI